MHLYQCLTLIWTCQKNCHWSLPCTSNPRLESSVRSWSWGELIFQQKLVVLLALHVALPSKGHPDAMFHMFVYLTVKHDSHLALDPTYPQADVSVSIEMNWEVIYGNVREAIADSAPELQGKDMELQMFMDSNHVNDKVWK